MEPGTGTPQRITGSTSVHSYNPVLNYLYCFSTIWNHLMYWLVWPPRIWVPRTQGSLFCLPQITASSMVSCMASAQQAPREYLLKEWCEWVRDFKICWFRQTWVFSFTAPIPHINLYICSNIWMAQYLCYSCPHKSAIGVNFRSCKAEGRKLDSRGITGWTVP